MMKSFWQVPASCVQGVPRCSATAKYMPGMTMLVLGRWVTIEVLTLPRSMSLKYASMSRMESTAAPQAPTLPSASGSSEL